MYIYATSPYRTPFRLDYSKIDTPLSVISPTHIVSLISLAQWLFMQQGQIES